MDERKSRRKERRKVEEVMESEEKIQQVRKGEAFGWCLSGGRCKPREEKIF